MANGVDWQKVVTGIVLAAALLGLGWTTTRASDNDLQAVRKTHAVDTTELKERDKEAREDIQEIKETTARLDERSKAQTHKLDRILEKLN